MLRRSVFWAATNIPRSAWDPAHHNPNWSDSYAADIADRRHWPAKKWLIGLEPKTPSEWLKFSKRNLAYAYNGALRSCSTFPEMLVYYKEMKTRGVKVDVDTMNALLTRAARYERIDTEDVFLLFDELSRLGARPDIAVLETLHTVLDHSLAKPFEFREARRRQLVELYNYVAMEEMTRLGPQHAEALLASQMKRLRGNLRQLSASLSPSVYRRYFASIDTFERLVDEVHNFLWEFVSPDHPNVELPALRIRIPFVGSVMRRPAADARPDELSVVQFEDADVCSVLQAALERAIDRDFHDKRPVAERRAYLSLLTILTSSGVLYTSDLMAQLMDVVKYSREDAHRDLDAQRLLRFALRGSSSTQDDGYRELWRKIEPIIDGRVVGRYIAARNPWSLMRICFEQSNNKNAYSFNSFTAVAPPRSTSAVDEVSKSSSTELLVAEDSKPSSGRNHASSQRTPEALSMRWADIKKLVKTTGILTGSVHDQKNVEVFTGMAVFLRTAATGQRYGTTDDALAIQAVGAEGGLDASADKTATSMENLSLDLCRAIFQHAQELHGDMEKYISEHKGLEPEFEYWEAQLILMRVILDCCVMHNRSTAGGASTGGAASEELFKAAAEMRVRLVEESRTRFNGRMRILWLQEV